MHIARVPWVVPKGAAFTALHKISLIRISISYELLRFRIAFEIDIHNIKIPFFHRASIFQHINPEMASQFHISLSYQIQTLKSIYIPRRNTSPTGPYFSQSQKQNQYLHSTHVSISSHNIRNRPFHHGEIALTLCGSRQL
jgi:hypothetical protein